MPKNSTKHESSAIGNLPQVFRFSLEMEKAFPH
jgi:hypothetical protein